MSLIHIKKLNIADYFSIYRIIAAPVIIVSIIFEEGILTSALLGISFFTDAIDGYIARKKKIATSRGASLDSIGDHMTALVGMVAFIVFDTGFFLNHLLIIVVIVLLFLLQLIVALIKFKKPTSYHTYLAKLMAVLLAVLLVITPAWGANKLLFYATFLIGIAEAMEEIALTFVLEEPKHNVKGLYWVLKKEES